MPAALFHQPGATMLSRAFFIGLLANKRHLTPLAQLTCCVLGQPQEAGGKQVTQHRCKVWEGPALSRMSNLSQQQPGRRAVGVILGTVAFPLPSAEPLEGRGQMRAPLRLQLQP